MKFAWFLMGALVAVFTPPVHATTLGQAAQQAVLQNPEVQARWRAFNSTLAEQDAARGGYYPRVDITASTGREHLEQPNQADKDFRGAL